MADLFNLALTLLLIAANAFFVGAEFALISARRDRLEILAEQGRQSAVTVIRAGEQLSRMLAGAQLGVTVCSILLGRIGEPAVADLLEPVFRLVGIPDALLHTVAFIVALTIVVTLHVLFGEMVPKNIALAGPETAAMLLIPPYLVYMAAARPFIVFYNWCAGVTLRAVRVQPKDELEITVSTVELSEMIAESVSAGLLDLEEYTRLTRALQIRTRVVADVAVPVADIRSVPAAAVGRGPTVAAVEQAFAQTGYSRFPVVDRGAYVGYLHIKDVLALGDGPDSVVDIAAVRPLPRMPASLPLADALSTLRRSNSHLALALGDDGAVVAMVALEDLVEDVVGTVRDGTHRV
ncbi:hemolysin family protein [Mycolicibacter sp. MYC123]|uniref:Hemolysin family protein n=1 Tax=[Mycobacterium] zoologicum TaxID=2872311 RepID=A0ABU5YJI4_9MYCO|nr:MULTISPECIES: hemolysin family protein [unclassified Mycolicibacter]MEB3050193.1 hemolysin family protein [Mycolicibacter sp. MYC123]MEB3063728.1 hemolysin family protein [Mycolicibacter sp. MYC101]